MKHVQWRTTQAFAYILESMNIPFGMSVLKNKLHLPQLQWGISERQDKESEFI
ncbi:hypothetical protein P4534_05505 [Peribacillus butanolivorans]|uniref:hypothetical protein n=1 Tax=Peribacillus butanolivorans TaxID=421767 RepID=UPI002E1D75CA|nr:hypothetical protein [Peribacillus butanolivorans]